MTVTGPKTYVFLLNRHENNKLSFGGCVCYGSFEIKHLVKSVWGTMFIMILASRKQVKSLKEFYSSKCSWNIFFLFLPHTEQKIQHLGFLLNYFQILDVNCLQTFIGQDFDLFFFSDKVNIEIIIKKKFHNLQNSIIKIAAVFDF